jgi:hypothetical protein
MLWVTFFPLKDHITQHIHLRHVLSSTSCCVLDCSYVFRNQQFTHRLKGRCHLLFWPILVHLLVDTYIFIWTFSCGSGAETAYPSGAYKFTLGFGGAHDAQYSAFCVVCCRSMFQCLFLCPFSIGHCVVCLSSIVSFWLSLWYLQTFLTKGKCGILGDSIFILARQR